MTEWYLYLIRCNNGHLYTGIATDVARRLKEHQGKGNLGAKYLRGKGPLTIVFQQKLGSRNLASKVERKIKKLTRTRKELLIQEKTQIEELIQLVK